MRNVDNALERDGWPGEEVLKSAPVVSSPTEQPIIHVLYAEDDADDAIIVKSRLKQSGLPIELKIVPDGSLAIEYILRRGAYKDRSPAADPRVVITDLSMRCTDAFALIKFIRSYPPCKCLPVVVYSGSEHEERINAALEAGASIVIPKSSNVAELIEYLGRLVRYFAAPLEHPMDLAPGGRKKQLN
jgi:CheY-like chemotaxis protein